LDKHLCIGFVFAMSKWFLF